jgi:large repetitive protein
MKKVVLFIISGILLLGIPATVYIVGKNAELRKRAAPATTLSLIPSQGSKRVNETFSLDVKIDTGDNQVATIQLQIVFDPTKFQAINITNGALAPTIRVSGKVDTSGVATITVGASDTTHPITGIGSIAVITLKAISTSATPATIQFSPAPDTFINAFGEGENNVLVGSSGASITILNADGSTAINDTETPTPTPTGQSPLGGATLTPTPTSIQNQNTQILQILSPENNESLTTDTPSFTGTASPGATITLTIESTPQTVIITADADGNWNYAPSAPLTAGQHSVTALTTDPTTGASETTTASFVIASGEDSTEPSSGSAVAASGSAIPETGSIETTIILMAIGVLLILGGTLLPFVSSDL